MQLLYIITSHFLDLFFPKSDALRALELDLAQQSPNAVFSQAKEIQDGSIVLFDYKDEKVRTLIWEIKYQGNRKLAAICVELLSEKLPQRSPFILIPIPISNKRRRERGYNQTEIIAEALMRHLKEPSRITYLPKALLKTSHTESQSRTHATRHERAENMAFSMSVAQEYESKLKGASIILLDDVTTSGATFTEAKRALGAVGARDIFCAALAH
ncbi:MAG: competence protein competence protein ComFC [Parcubacteria group bacterium]|nr:competence protein competence protein ComFC [Parcubacteria group bacterium]